MSGSVIGNQIPNYRIIPIICAVGGVVGYNIDRY